MIRNEAECQEALRRLNSLNYNLGSLTGCFRELAGRGLLRIACPAQFARASR